MLLFFMFIQVNHKRKVDTKNKMDNPRFVDEETIPLVQDKDYDDYNAPNTSRVERHHSQNLIPPMQPRSYG